MNPLETFVTAYLAQNAPVYFVRQLIVIMCLFCYGGVLCDVLLPKTEAWIKRAVLAFPVGIAAFSITAYVMLTAGIRYSSITVCIAVAAEIIAAVLINRRSSGNITLGGYRKHMLIAFGAALAVAALATSGFMGVAISNESMYYFRRYPDAIVYYGGLRESFDFFLTDTGLGAVSIDTLPALFGFGETFGIREFFHLDFIAFFALTVYERSKRYISGRNCVAAAALITAFLAVSTPFVILGHWALANMYFMEMFFIVAYRLVDGDGERIGAEMLMLIGLSLFRIEGTLFVVWLMVCVAIFKDIGRKLALYAALPVALLFSCYCIRIFGSFYIFDNIYHFLTPVKAVLLIAMIAGSGVFMAFIQPRLPEKICHKLPLLYVLAMIFANIALLVYNRELYIGNLKMFAANQFRQSGWGMMPYYVIAMTALLVVEYGIRRIKKGAGIDGSNTFNITMLLGYVLLVIAASFGRGDILAEAVGDSGNRVLLQVVPIAVITYGELFIGLLSDRS